LLLLTRTAKEEGLFSVVACATPFAPALINLTLDFVRDEEVTGVAAGTVVNVNHEVGHFSCKIEVLGHGDVHVCHLASDKADLLLERNSNVELGIVNDGANG